MNILEANIQTIIFLCKKYKVKTLSVFGSVLTNRFSPTSDIDLLVEFDSIPPEEYADNYFSFKESLSSVLGREVDLLELKGIKNTVLLNNIDRTKKQLYGGVC